MRPPKLESRPPIGQTSREAIERAARHRIVRAGELLRYAARHRANGDFRYQVWKVVFVLRDEEGRERLYPRFRDLVPNNRQVTPMGYAHDELVDPATQCPVCGQPNK
jgi:hypothetical protein